MKFVYPAGATPLDPDDTAGLKQSHITTRGQLDEWEFKNVTEGNRWAFTRKKNDILSIEFMRQLHKRMFGDTWIWAGVIRTKETLPVGIAPERIRVELKKLCEGMSKPR